MSTKVKVAYGACECEFDLDGKTVTYVRSALAGLLNVPTDAQTRINGSPIRLNEEESIKLQSGDQVAFIKAMGDKGLGDLIPSVKLMARWNITQDQFEELIQMGLPKVVFKDGSIWHFEVAVDEWCRQSVPAGIDRSSRRSEWCHGGSEQHPTNYHGPLVGNKKELASWLYSDRKPDPRRLQARAKTGRIWVRQNTVQEYEVWFRTHQEFAEANARRLEDQKENGSK